MKKKIIAVLGLLGVMVSTSSVSCMGPYEIENGLSGMRRDVVLRLINKMGIGKKADKKIRNLLGMCQTYWKWKNHSYFKKSRILRKYDYLKISEEIYMETYKDLPRLQVEAKTYQLLADLLGKNHTAQLNQLGLTDIYIKRLSDTNLWKYVEEYLNALGHISYNTANRVVVTTMLTLADKIKIDTFNTPMEEASTKLAWLRVLDFYVYYDSPSAEMIPDNMLECVLARYTGGYGMRILSANRDRLAIISPYCIMSIGDHEVLTDLKENQEGNVYRLTPSALKALKLRLNAETL